MDSLLLCRVMADICAERLQVVYINHQLQADSELWGEHIAQFCQNYQLKFQSIRVDVANGNVEQQARIARYQAFAQLLSPQDVLILAHHQQDQAETLMLRLLSGTGVRGLGAMKYCEYRQQQQYFIWRPFLNYSRQQLTQWAEQLQLNFVHDPMNDDERFDRIWCRKTLWQVLEQRFPQMQNALARTSQIMQDADEILYEIAVQDWASCGHQHQLNIYQLQQLSHARQRQVLSLFMQGEHEYRPSFDMVERLQLEVISSRDDAQARLHYQQYDYVRYGQILYRYHHQQWLQFQQKPLEQEFIFNMGINLQLSTGLFNIQSVEYWGLSRQLLGQTLELKNAVDGLKISLHQRQGSKSFKKFCQEYKIPVWWRLSIQFLYFNGQLLGVFIPNRFILAQSDFVERDGCLPMVNENRAS